MSGRFLTRRGLPILACALLLLVAPLRFAPAASAAQGDGWIATNITLPDLYQPLCVDEWHPYIFYAADLDKGRTVAYQWYTGQATYFPSTFDSCGANGFLFKRLDNGAGLRFSIDDPATQTTLAHGVTLAAHDGTQQVYSLSGADNTIFASADAGLSWQARAVPGPGRLENMALSALDALSIYAITVQRANAQGSYSIFYSSDAGAHWERRSSAQAAAFDQYGGPYFSIQPIPGATTPVGAVELAINPGYGGSSNQIQVLVSTDGARSFVPVGVRRLGIYTTLAHTSKAILRMTAGQYDYTLDRSTDGGRTWQALAKPSQPGYNPLAQPALIAGSLAADHVLISDASGVMLSTDGGQSWRQISKEAIPTPLLALTPYAPLTALRVQDHRVSRLDLRDADKSLTAPVLPNGVPNGISFGATGHNLWGGFAAYWQTHGGLEQFGYPHSEPFRESSDYQHKVYVVQYFERNRFEYHPENQPPYDVLLGRLGVTAAAPLIEAHHGAFNRFADMHYEHGIYFAPTGHNLRNSFLDYWQANGGLAIYGYPISEEFEQVSPTDGKTYIVQYFERNRFEYHPENKGTRYEVLLGLLGNDLLLGMGWLH